MAKPSAINGSMMIEMMLVMLILSILFSQVIQTSPSSLRLFGLSLMNRCIQMQEQAYAYKEKRSIQLESTYAKFDDTLFSYPDQIVCDPFSFHYNAKGNISQASTVTCHQNHQSIRLVFQLGSGRVRIE